MKKLVFNILFTLIFFQIFIISTEASFGISPADLTFEYLLPGITVEKEYLLSRSDLSKEADIVVETDINEADGWITVYPGVAFTIPRGERSKTMKIIVSVPKNAKQKEYNGYVTLKVADDGKTSGVSVINGVSIAAKLNVTKSEVAKLLIRKIDIPEITEGEPIAALITVENLGNQEVSLENVKITVNDVMGNEALKAEDTSVETTDPGSTKIVRAEFDNTLKRGEYNANIQIVFKDETIKEEKLVFLVKEKVIENQQKFEVVEGENHFRWALLRFVLLSVIPITLIWMVIRKKYLK